MSSPVEVYTISAPVASLNSSITFSNTSCSAPLHTPATETVWPLKSGRPSSPEPPHAVTTSNDTAAAAAARRPFGPAGFIVSPFPVSARRPGPRPNSVLPENTFNYLVRVPGHPQVIIDHDLGFVELVAHQ